MGYKYEVETYYYEDAGLWKTGYMGDSLIKAVWSLIKARRRNPGRCYRLVVR